MGLDWIPADVPKRGHEAEFECLRKKISWNLPFVSRYWKRRYDEIAISPCETIVEPQGSHSGAVDACPGIPQFTHAGAYDGVDQTSFRGEFVLICQDLITDELRQRAYSPFTPTEAIEYGRALYRRASKIAVSKGLDPATAQAGADDDPRDSIEGQIEVFRSASEWFIFWGGKGHGIRPWA
jgi:hypothetical protein